MSQLVANETFKCMRKAVDDMIRNCSRGAQLVLANPNKPSNFD